jgi:hypothetical protein
MPIGLDPDRTVPITLSIDAGRSGAPVFHVRFPTPRRQRQVRELLDQADTAVNAWLALPRETEHQAQEAMAARDRGRGEGARLLVEALRLTLAGWTGLRDEDGQDIPWAPDAGPAVLGELLDLAELAELVNLALSETRLKATDLFFSGSRSESPSPSGAAGQAPEVAAPATASTP